MDTREVARAMEEQAHTTEQPSGVMDVLHNMERGVKVRTFELDEQTDEVLMSECCMWVNMQDEMICLCSPGFREELQINSMAMPFHAITGIFLGKQSVELSAVEQVTDDTAFVLLTDQGFSWHLQMTAHDLVVDWLLGLNHLLGSNGKVIVLEDDPLMPLDAERPQCNFNDNKNSGRFFVGLDLLKLMSLEAEHDNVHIKLPPSDEVFDKLMSGLQVNCKTAPNQKKTKPSVILFNGEIGALVLHVHGNNSADDSSAIENVMPVSQIALITLTGTPNKTGGNSMTIQSEENLVWFVAADSFQTITELLHGLNFILASVHKTIVGEKHKNEVRTTQYRVRQMINPHIIMKNQFLAGAVAQQQQQQHAAAVAVAVSSVSSVSSVRALAKVAIKGTPFHVDILSSAKLVLMNRFVTFRSTSSPEHTEALIERMIRDWRAQDPSLLYSKRVSYPLPQTGGNPPSDDGAATAEGSMVTVLLVNQPIQRELCLEESVGWVKSFAEVLVEYCTDLSAVAFKEIRPITMFKES